MPEIQNTEISFRKDGDDLFADVTVYVQFSQREVSENFDYGVSVSVIRDDPQVMAIPRRSAPAAMTLYIIPPNASAGFQLTGGGQTVRPDGNANLRVQLAMLVNNAPVPGTMAKAISVVAPEFAAVEGQSGSVSTV